MASVASVPAFMQPGVPVVHPPQLEGDPSLATEVLPGPPPVASVHLAMQKQDIRKPLATPSYLPTSDPGTSYTGHGTVPVIVPTGFADPEGPRRKRARTERGAANVARRASTRSLASAANVQNSMIPTAPVASSSHIDEAEPLPLSATAPEPPVLSRQSSALNVAESNGDSVSARTRGSRRDKGKGKERAAPVVRVKEEATDIGIPPMRFSPPRQMNDDHCSACRSAWGRLVYCDTCTRAYHLWCNNPPLDQDDLTEYFYCNACTIAQDPVRRASVPKHLGFMSSLVHQAEIALPVEFQLPDDIRSFFRDVGTDPRGAYVDSSLIKKLRLNRHGQVEERDPHRLQDRDGDAVLCFACKLSAMPFGDPENAPSSKRPRRSSSRHLSGLDGYQSMVSCDYCNLHWHLDCVDPPLPSMPAFGKKWMCPNHAEQLTLPRRRIPKQNNAPIDIIKPNQPNNGNIEVLLAQTALTPPAPVTVDEPVVNGRRYRVPERVITLDFWSRLNKSEDDDQCDETDAISTMSSLTSLSSEEEVRRKTASPAKGRSSARLYSLEDIQLAQLLCSLRPPSAPAAPPHLFSANYWTDLSSGTLKDVLATTQQSAAGQNSVVTPAEISASTSYSSQPIKLKPGSTIKPPPSSASTSIPVVTTPTEQTVLPISRLTNRPREQKPLASSISDLSSSSINTNRPSVSAADSLPSISHYANGVSEVPTPHRKAPQADTKAPRTSRRPGRPRADQQQLSDGDYKPARGRPKQAANGSHARTASISQSPAILGASASTSPSAEGYNTRPRRSAKSASPAKSRRSAAAGHDSASTTTIPRGDVASTANGSEQAHDVSAHAPTSSKAKAQAPSSGSKASAKAKTSSAKAAKAQQSTASLPDVVKTEPVQMAPLKIRLPRLGSSLLSLSAKSQAPAPSAVNGAPASSSTVTKDAEDG